MELWESFGRFELQCSLLSWPGSLTPDEFLPCRDPLPCVLWWYFICPLTVLCLLHVRFEAGEMRRPHTGDS